MFSDCSDSCTVGPAGLPTGGGNPAGSTVNGSKGGPKQGGVRRRIRNYGTEVDIIRPCHWFGEYCCMSSSTESKSPFTLVTNEYTELLVLSKSSFQAILQDHFVSLLMKKATFLCTQYSMIHSWSIPYLSHLCAILQEKTYSINDIILKQGSTVNNIYFIKEGLLRLSFNEGKVKIADVSSKIHPPIGLLAQILNLDSNNTRASSGKRQNTSAHSQPSKSSAEEREHTLKRYGHRELNLLKETPLCVLTTGGLVGAIESLCDLKEYLFTVVTESSSVSLYQLNIAQFNALFCGSSCPDGVVEEEVLFRLLVHIRHWRYRFARVELFEFLVLLFEQKLQELERSRLMRESGEREQSRHHRRPQILPKLIKDFVCR